MCMFQAVLCWAACLAVATAGGNLPVPLVIWHGMGRRLDTRSDIRLCVYVDTKATHAVMGCRILKSGWYSRFQAYTSSHYNSVIVLLWTVGIVFSPVSIDKWKWRVMN